MQTVGFGISIIDFSQDLNSKINELALKYNYYISYEYKNFNLEISEGILVLEKSFNLNIVALVHSPANPQIATSYGIIDELRNAYHDGTKSKFGKFLYDLISVLTEFADQIIFFFANEWYTNDRIRLLEGSVEELINLLEGFGNWHIMLYDLNNKTYYEDIDTPLVFIVRAKK